MELRQFSDLPRDMTNPSIRRDHLARIARDNKIPVTHKHTKADLIKLLNAKQVKVDADRLLPDVDGADERRQLETMKIFDLRALAKELGVKFSNTTKASELRELILGVIDD